MLTVWGRPNSINVQIVMWTAAELGLEVDRKDVGGAFGGLDTPEYLAMNPNGRIPTIQDGDLTIWESNACARYLAAQYGSGSLWPEDPAERAKADMWMDWKKTSLAGPMTSVNARFTLLDNPVELEDVSRKTRAGSCKSQRSEKGGGNGIRRSQTFLRHRLVELGINQPRRQNRPHNKYLQDYFGRYEPPFL